MEEDIWAIVSRFFQKSDPPMIFTGTTITSPGSMRVERTFELYHSPDRLPITDPLARMTKISLRLATSLVPPARRRYQPASLPGTKVMAEALYTCPVTSPTPGRL